MSLPADTPLLPLVVFFAELCVVTLCTLRIIFVSRGMKALASGLGFFEITIWLFAIGQIMRNLTDIGCFMGFAAGFTCGNYLGIIIENKLALGTLVIRTITSKDATELIHGFRAAHYGVTRIDGQGATGPVQMVFTVVQRKELANAVAIIKGFDPRAFYSVESIQMAAAGVFPLARTRWRAAVLAPLRRLRSAA
jgi:uncharacterized protein YebE (UPF0316 family)